MVTILSCLAFKSCFFMVCASEMVAMLNIEYNACQNYTEFFVHEIDLRISSILYRLIIPQGLTP